MTTTQQRRPAATAGRRPALGRLRSARGRPSAVALLLAGATVALVATPVIFLVSELVDQPDGEVWSVLLRPRTRSLMVNTVILVVAVTLGTLMVGIPTAYLLERTDLLWARGWHVVAALPLAVPSYVAGFAWVSLTPVRGFWGSVIVLTLVTSPYVTLPVAAALRRADTDAEAVARTLGAGPVRAFWTCTLPQVAPAAGAGALLVALYTLGEFGAIAIMRYPALTWAIQTAFGGTFNRALALVLCVVLVALALVVVTAERSVRGRVAGQGRVRGDEAPGRMPLGRTGQFLAGTGLAAVAAAGIGVPVATMLLRAVQSVAEREVEVARLAEAAWTTVLLGFAGAALATVLALPIGILAARHRTRTVGALETATYLGHGLPGIVLGLSMVYLVLQFAPAFYQTLTVMVVAYGILFVPKAAGSVRAAVAQVPLELEDAARSLGRSPTGVWTAVTARLAWPGIAAGALLVALTVMKELPATLLMRPTGTDTLATRMWQLTDIAAYGAAAPYAVVLVLLASVPAFLLSRRMGERP